MYIYIYSIEIARREGADVVNYLVAFRRISRRCGESERFCQNRRVPLKRDSHDLPWSPFDGSEIRRKVDTT